jgi:hypothetical protein
MFSTGLQQFLVGQVHGYGHGIMSHCDQAHSVFLQKRIYVTWILDEDFECLGKEMFI